MLVLDVEKDSNDMHEHHAQQAIAQMPQIPRPDPFGPTAVDELTENGLNALAHSTQDGTPTVRGRMFGGAKRGEQDNAQSSQAGFEFRQPIIAVAQQQTGRTRGQLAGRFAFMHVGCSQVQVGDDAGPGDGRMEAKAVEGLSHRVIEAFARLAFKARAARRTGKLADRQRKAVDDGRRGVRGEQRITDQAPDALFDGPQLGGLPHKGAAIYLQQARKEVVPMALKKRF
jgi:hypothetical protein